MPKRILVVESDEAHAQALIDALRRVGLDAEVAPDGRSARRAAGQDRFAAALVAVRLPDTDCESIVADLRRTPGGALLPILLTGHVDTQDLVANPTEALAVGADYYFHLPDDLGTVGERVRGWVGDAPVQDAAGPTARSRQARRTSSFDDDATDAHLPTLAALREAHAAKLKSSRPAPARPRPKPARPKGPRDQALALVRDGEGLRSKGKVDEAIDAYLTAAELYQQAEKVDPALALFKLVLHLAPTRADVALTAGGLAAQEGRLADASAIYRRAADALEKDGNREEALTLVNRLVEISPSDPALVLRQATLEAEIRHDRQAEAPPPPEDEGWDAALGEALEQAAELPLSSARQSAGLETLRAARAQTSVEDDEADEALASLETLLGDGTEIIAPVWVEPEEIAPARDGSGFGRRPPPAEDTTPDPLPARPAGAWIPPAVADHEAVGALHTLEDDTEDGPAHPTEPDLAAEASEQVITADAIPADEAMADAQTTVADSADSDRSADDDTTAGEARATQDDADRPTLPDADEEGAAREVPDTAGAAAEPPSGAAEAGPEAPSGGETGPGLADASTEAWPAAVDEAEGGPATVDIRHGHADPEDVAWAPDRVETSTDPVADADAALQHDLRGEDDADDPSPPGLPTLDESTQLDEAEADDAEAGARGLVTFDETTSKEAIGEDEPAAASEPATVGDAASEPDTVSGASAASSPAYAEPATVGDAPPTASVVDQATLAADHLPEAAPELALGPDLPRPEVREASPDTALLAATPTPPWPVGVDEDEGEDVLGSATLSDGPDFGDEPEVGLIELDVSLESSVVAAADPLVVPAEPTPEPVLASHLLDAELLDLESDELAPDVPQEPLPHSPTGTMPVEPDDVLAEHAFVPELPPVTRELGPRSPSGGGIRFVPTTQEIARPVDPAEMPPWRDALESAPHATAPLGFDDTEVGAPRVRLPSAVEDFGLESAIPLADVSLEPPLWGEVAAGFDVASFEAPTLPDPALEPRPLTPTQGRLSSLSDALVLLGRAVQQRATGVLHLQENVNLVLAEGVPAARRGKAAVQAFIRLLRETGQSLGHAGLELLLEREADRPVTVAESLVTRGKMHPAEGVLFLNRHLEDALGALLDHRGGWWFEGGAEVRITRDELVPDRLSLDTLLTDLLSVRSPWGLVEGGLGPERRFRRTGEGEPAYQGRDHRLWLLLDGRLPLGEAGHLAGVSPERAAAMAALQVNLRRLTALPPPRPEPSTPDRPWMPLTGSITPGERYAPVGVPPATRRLRAMGAEATLPHGALAELDAANRIRALAELVRTSDYFTILGVDTAAGKADIDRAHHQLRGMIQVPPPGQDPSLERLAREIIRSLDEARDVLKVPELRTAYLAHLRR